jgi:hypothetical protein
MGGLGVSGQRHLKDGLFIAKLALEKKSKNTTGGVPGPKGSAFPKEAGM